MPVRRQSPARQLLGSIAGPIEVVESMLTLRNIPILRSSWIVSMWCPYPYRVTRRSSISSKQNTDPWFFFLQLTEDTHETLNKCPYLQLRERHQHDESQPSDFCRQGVPYPTDHAKIVIPSNTHISHSHIETNTYSKRGGDDENDVASKDWRDSRFTCVDCRSPHAAIEETRADAIASSRLTVEMSFPSGQEPIGVSKWIHVPGRGARGWNYVMNFCKIRAFGMGNPRIWNNLSFLLQYGDREPQ